VERIRRLINRDVDSYAADKVDYLVAFSQTYDKYLQRPLEFPQEAAAYRDLFQRIEFVTAIRPSSGHPGPEIRVFRIPR
jgi:hypothetical protein